MLTAYRANNNLVWFSTFQQLYFVNGDTVKLVLKYPDYKTAFYFIAETPAVDQVGINQRGILRVNKTDQQLIPILQNKELL